jgi:hypothetical protein
MMLSSSAADGVWECICHSGTSLATEAEADHQANQCDDAGHKHRRPGIAKVQRPSETNPARCFCGWKWVGVEFWWGFEPGDLGGDFDVPVFFVDEVVVAAEQDAVARAGGFRLGTSR